VPLRALNIVVGKKMEKRLNDQVLEPIGIKKKQINLLVK
jgi:hypothetical protein